MNKSVFQISRTLILLPVAVALLPALQLAWYWRLHGFGLANVVAGHWTLAVLLLTLGPLYMSGLQLVITDEKVEQTDRWLNLYAFTLRWREVVEVSLLKQRNAWTILLRTAAVGRALNPMIWTLVSSSLPVKEREAGWLEIRPQPEEKALVKVIAHYWPEALHLEGRKATRHFRKNMELGAAAGWVAAISFAMAMLAVTGLFLQDAKPLENDLMWLYLVPIGIMSACAVFEVLKEKTQRIAAYLCGALFAVCFCWALNSGSHLYAQAWGERTVTHYALVETSDARQRWKAAGEDVPDIEINADPGNLKYTRIGELRDFTLMRGPLGVVDVPKDEIQAILRKKQTFSRLRR